MSEYRSEATVARSNESGSNERNDSCALVQL
jgi:hypothetical protein